MKYFLLSYKVAYNHNPAFSYARYPITAKDLTGAKAIVSKKHPKATRLQFVEVLVQKSIK
jgi:hypothetical protein